MYHYSSRFQYLSAMYLSSKYIADTHTPQKDLVDPNSNISQKGITDIYRIFQKRLVKPLGKANCLSRYSSSLSPKQQQQQQQQQQKSTPSADLHQTLGAERPLVLK